MRKTTFLFVVAAFTLISCTKEIKSVDTKGEQLTFTASAAGSETKTVLQQDGVSLWWAPGDEINLFYGNVSASKFISQNQEAAQVASFTGILDVATGIIETGNEGKSFWGVYPYSSSRVCDDSSVTVSVPSAQQPAAGTFPVTLFPSVAKSTSLNLAFYNVCGGLKFSVSYNDVKSITFKATGGQTIAGDVKVGFGEDGKPVVSQVVNGVSEITITPSEGQFFQTGKDYYVVMLPAVLSEGFRAVVSRENTAGVKNKSAQVTVARSSFGVLEQIDKDIDYDIKIGTYVQEYGGGVVYATEKDSYLLASLTEAHNLPWKDAISWCKSYGDGNWYLPSIDELKTLQKQVGTVNTTISGIPGSQMLYTGNICYWSSTENGEYAWRMKMDGQIFSEGSDERKTSTANYTRAIRRVYYNDIKNLSASGTSNCYIVPAAGTYKFNASVKGNSTESVGAPAYADVLWESFGTDVAPSIGDIITSASLADGYVTFSTPETLVNGNAVIAVKDANGTILWSWHIWVCNGFNPVATQQIYANNAGTMMDRDLGATSAEPGSVNALGLFYEWGRKDPFLGNSSITDNTPAQASITWPNPVTSSPSCGTIEYATQNPTVYINGGGHWNTDVDMTLWNSTKTKYDPCPYGWQVPEGGQDGLWAKAFKNYNSAAAFEAPEFWSDTNHGMLITSSITGAAAWYPAGGYIDSNSYNRYYNGNYCYRWSITPKDSNVYVFSILCSWYYTTAVIRTYQETMDPSSGHPVRCCKE